MTKKKQCQWCDKPMAYSNFRRHLMKCVFKNELGIKKSDVEILKVSQPKEKTQIEEANIMELKNFLTDNFNKTSTLYKRIIVENNRDPVEKIKEMMISDSTKENYIREWNQFSKWLRKKNLSMSVDSANSYIASLDCAASTQRTKQTILQIILQHIIDRNIYLNRRRRNISFAPKKALSDEELNKYLEEQKSLCNREEYLIQKLLILYGLRVNTIALLKIKDLEFLLAGPGEERLIHLPDSKTKRRRVEKIPSDIEDDFKAIIGMETDPEDYVFYKSGENKDMRRRAQDIGLKINKKIRQSKVIKKIGGYKYSSHMFRKTKAYNMFHKKLDELKEEVRLSIGQSQGSQAIEHYIN